jgi:carboxyl-terminal processing protease
MKALFSIPALVLLAGCGGGNAPQSVDAPAPGPAPAPAPVPADPPPVPPPPPPPPVPPPEPPVRDLEYYMNRCVAKPGTTPGTLQDEQNFLRLWIDATYLWYREVPAVDLDGYSTAVDYFHVLKTPLLTASGSPKDRFHFSYPDARWRELSGGQQQGYGITWVKFGETVPRDWRIAAVEAESPASAAGLQRGDRLMAIDGIDFIQATGDDVDLLNKGLVPAAGATHRLTLERAGVQREAALVSASVTVAPVQNTRIIDTAQGRVGYLRFGSHIAAAEAQLVASVTTLRDAAVTDLVLDMRYNGGGLLSIASKLSYMIAGAQATTGRTFEQTIANDKTKQEKPILFRAASSQGTTLPALNLKRVFVLAGPGTCSASESVINGLRGIDIDVHLIGGTTCGKPYAFIPTSHCGTTYFAVQYQGINAKGFGDYGDGFAPVCRAQDDLDQPLGSTSEGMLAAALRFRETGSCPAPASAAARSAARAPFPVPVRPEAAEVTINDLP